MAVVAVTPAAVDTEVETDVDHLASYCVSLQGISVIDPEEILGSKWNKIVAIRDLY